MATTARSTIVGVFDDRREAERAVEELRRVGFRDDQIGVAVRGDETTGTSTAAGTTDLTTGESAATGALGGGVIGGLLGALATGLIPGVGPVLAGGLLAGILGGAAAGAATGGIIGALVGMGVPEEEAHYYDSEFRAGRVIVTVKADGRYQEASSILARYGARTEPRTGTAGHTVASGVRETGHTIAEGARDVGHTIASGTREAGHKVAESFREMGQAVTGTPRAEHTTASQTTEGGQKIQLREEELRAQKQPIETGEVNVRKDVVTEHRTIDVPVTREEVVVERHPVQGRESTGTPIGSEQEIRIPVREERVTVEKQPVVKEEITVGKRTVQDTAQVSGTVKKEEAHIEREGDVKVKSTGSEQTHTRDNK